jgi:hypothetical protein
MTRTIRVLLLSALMLQGAGWVLYHYGSQQNTWERGRLARSQENTWERGRLARSQENLEVLKKDETLWDQEPGDKWLYVGGLMMLISGALAAAAVRVWKGGRRAHVISHLNVARDRQDSRLPEITH